MQSIFFYTVTPLQEKHTDLSPLPRQLTLALHNLQSPQPKPTLHKLEPWRTRELGLNSGIWMRMLPQPGGTSPAHGLPLKPETEVELTVKCQLA